MATQVVSRVREVLQIEFALRRFFEFPTIAELSSELDRKANDASLPQPQEDLPPLVPHSREKDIPLSFSQQRLWFLDQLKEGDPA